MGEKMFSICHGPLLCADGETCHGTHAKANRQQNGLEVHSDDAFQSVIASTYLHHNARNA
jgi:hypothetical protein